MAGGGNPRMLIILTTLKVRRLEPCFNYVLDDCIYKLCVENVCIADPSFSKF